jgi:hypothetical protein
VLTGKSHGRLDFRRADRGKQYLNLPQLGQTVDAVRLQGLYQLSKLAPAQARKSHTSGMFSSLDILNATNENRGQTAPSGCGECDNLNGVLESWSRQDPKYDGVPALEWQCEGVDIKTTVLPGGINKVLVVMRTVGRREHGRVYTGMQKMTLDEDVCGRARFIDRKIVGHMQDSGASLACLQGRW